MGGPWQSASPKRGDFCPCFTCRWEGGRALLPSCVSLSLSHWGSALFGFLPCGNSSRTGCVSVCAQSCVRSSTWACNQQQKSLQGESFGLRGTKLSIIVVLWTFTFFSLSLSLCQLFFFFFKLVEGSYFCACVWCACVRIYVFFLFVYIIAVLQITVTRLWHSFYFSRGWEQTFPTDKPLFARSLPILIYTWMLYYCILYIARRGLFFLFWRGEKAVFFPTFVLQGP